MIPEATLHQIQERVDIVEVVSSYVTLRRSGKNFKANCPFHQERTPSFMVNPDKQIFHCFGCAVGGNVFSFLMKIEKKDFLEVVEELAERVGVELPKGREASPAVEERANQFMKAHRLAADLYEKILAGRREAESARRYLQKRGLKPEAIAEFHIGYAPESWDTLVLALKDQVPSAVLEKSGLAIAKREGGGFYDRFRNRIMFPILDTKGRCVAFGGRVMDDSTPKYLNSPETEIYSKGRNLYGLFQARQAVREADAAIVVEGYLDLIACHQAGFRNVVASLGTALTSEQVRLIRRLTNNVFILYDGDKAGEAATLRGLELFLEEGMDVKIVRLAEGHDPDSFLKAYGDEKFRQALGAAKTLFEYKLALLKKANDPKTVEGRVRIANELVTLLAKVPNEILRAAWIQELAREIGLSEQALAAQMKKNAPTPRPARLAPELKVTQVEGSAPATERLALGILMLKPDWIARTRERLGVNDFESETARKVARAVFDGETGPGSISRLLSLFQEDAEAVQLIASAGALAESAADPERVLADCVARLQKRRLHGEREKLLAGLLSAEREGDSKRINEFMSHMNELNKKEKEIHEKK